MLVIHDPALLQRWDDAKARQKAAHKSLSTDKANKHPMIVKQTKQETDKQCIFLFQGHNLFLFPKFKDFVKSVTNEVN